MIEQIREIAYFTVLICWSFQLGSLINCSLSVELYRTDTIKPDANHKKTPKWGSSLWVLDWALCLVHLAGLAALAGCYEPCGIHLGPGPILGDSFGPCWAHLTIRPDRGSFNHPADYYPFNHPADHCPFNHPADNYPFNNFTDN